MATKKQKTIAGTAIAAIIAAVFTLEGGYVNNPSDPGGATNHGITERVARANGYQGHMRDLTRERAETIYADQYIRAPNFDDIAELDRWVAEELVDSGVNTGPGRAARWFQESLNHLNRRGADYPDIKVDGQIGPGTLNAFQRLRQVRGTKLACELMIKLMDAKQAQHYANLAGDNSQFETFMVGWVRTRIGNVSVSDCQ